MTGTACVCAGDLSWISQPNCTLQSPAWQPIGPSHVLAAPPGGTIRLEGPVQFTDPTIAKELLILLERLGDDATIADLTKLLRSIIVEHALKTQNNEQGIETNSS
jgi:hypothetical protein